ncbi:MAG: hypothetical protein IJU45_04215 [Clostridia bacterium]|nr:hypothetical protein [Clostridia bacterium]
MKRFYCAVIILAFVFTSSFVLNRRIEQFTSELIDIVNEAQEPEQIQRFWNQNKKFVFMILPHNQTEAVSAAVSTLPDCKAVSEEYYVLKKAELVSKLEIIKDSLELSGENIF